VRGMRGLACRSRGGRGSGRRYVFRDGGLHRHSGLIDDLGDAFGIRSDAFGRETSGIVGELAGERDGAVLDRDVHTGRLQKRLGEHFGLDVRSDGVVGGLVAGDRKSQNEDEKRSQ